MRWGLSVSNVLLLLLYIVHSGLVQLFEEGILKAPFSLMIIIMCMASVQCVPRPPASWLTGLWPILAMPATRLNCAVGEEPHNNQQLRH